MEYNKGIALMTGVILYDTKEWINYYVDIRIANIKLNL